MGQQQVRDDRTIGDSLHRAPLSLIITAGIDSDRDRQIDYSVFVLE